MSRLPKNAGAYWVRALAGAGVVALLAGAALGYRQVVARRRQLCAGAENQLAGVWDKETKRRVEQAFLSIKQSYARTAWQSVERSLDLFARDWVAARGDSCDASQAREEPSDATFGLRALCLEQVLDEVKAHAALFALADAQVVQNAVAATRALPSPRLCSDWSGLRSKLKAPYDPPLRAKVQEVRAWLAEARALYSVGKYARGAELAKTAGWSANELGYGPLQSEALLALAQHQHKLGQAGAAKKAVEQAIAAAEANSQDEIAAQAWILLLRIGYQPAQPEEARRLSRFAAAAVRRLGPEHPLEGELYQAMAEALAAQNQHAQALVNFEKALAIRLRSRGEEGPEVANSLNDVGIAHARLGQPAKAVEEHRRALRIREKWLGADHPDVAVSLDNLSTVYSQMGRVEDALAAQERALAIRLAAFDEDHLQTGISLNNLGATNDRLGRQAQARSCYERAIAIYDKVLGPQHQALTSLLDSLGTLLLKLGEQHRALSLFKRALAINEKAWGADHLLNAALLVNIGKTLIAWHQPAEAIAPLKRAVSIREMREDHPAKLAAAQFALARALWESGHAKRRAKYLAIEAREAYASMGAPNQELAEIDDWLALRGWRPHRLASAATAPSLH
jgi:tetratricopeptide (TPR) repeat protein